MDGDNKFNFGCASCGYKEASEPIDVRRFLSKLDSCFDRGNMTEAGKVIEFWLNEAIKNHDKRGELTVVNEQLGYFRKISDEKNGTAAVSRAIALISEIGLDNSPSSAVIYLNAATTLKSFGKAEDALPLYDRALDIYISSSHPENDELAGFYNNYGLALADLGRFEEAEAAYKKALSILEGSGVNPNAAISYLNLIDIYGCMDDRDGDDIFDCLEKAYAVLTDERNEKNGAYYYVLSKCAPAFRDMGFEERADEFERQVKNFYERP